MPSYLSIMRFLRGYVTSEADHTPPSEWCPNPERWTAADADATEHEVTGLVAAFVRALQPELVVETGTYTGQTAFAIAAALLDNGHGRLVTIELDEHRAALARQYLEGLPVTVLWGTGDHYVPDAPVGFLWLDSGCDARHTELAHYRPYLAAGAVIGVHDTAPHHPVHERFKDEGGLRLRTPRGVSFFQ